MTIRIANRSSRFGSGNKMITSTADCSLRCGAKIYLINSLLLSIHSDILGRTLDGEFGEVLERTVDLSSNDPDCVERLVEYLYTFDYKAEDSNPLTQHAKILIFANHYEVQGLSGLALERFKAGSKQAEIGSGDFQSAAVLVYESGSAASVLCPIIVAAVVGNCREDGDDEKVTEDLEHLLGLNHDLSIDVAVAMRFRELERVALFRDLPKTWIFTCPSCEKKLA